MTYQNLTDVALVVHTDGRMLEGFGIGDGDPGVCEPLLASGRLVDYHQSEAPTPTTSQAASAPQAQPAADQPKEA